MNAQEKLNYLIGLYDWDEQTQKNLLSYAETLVEETLRKDAEFAKLVRDHAGEDELTLYIQQFTHPRYVISGEITEPLDFTGGIIQAEESHD